MYCFIAFKFFHEYSYETSTLIKAQDPYFNQFQEHECNFQNQTPAFQYFSTLVFVVVSFLQKDVIRSLAKMKLFPLVISYAK